MNSNNFDINDTFDNLSFSSIDNIYSTLNKKNSNNNKNTTINISNKHENEQFIDDDISLDDSMFLNDSIEPPKEENLLKITEKQQSQEFVHTNNLKNKKLISDSHCYIDEKVLDNSFKNLALTTPKKHRNKNTTKIINTSATEVNTNEIEASKTELSFWNLPKAVLEKYHSRNIKTMFQWQVECLSNSKVLNELSNLVYSAPTSAGKTLVSEILAIKTIIERRKKVIFILPFVSIVREKTYYFQDILGSSGVHVDSFVGSYNPPGGFAAVQLAICTIEKANSLINRLLEENRLSELGAVLIDELHLVGDPHRGYLLELLLTKLRYISLKDDSVKIQIIGMSATLPNLPDLANWLSAELYTTSFRPIPLHEQTIVSSGQVYDKRMNLIRTLKPLPGLCTDTDNILQLCLETIKESCSVLIFCPTKNWCENLSQQISSAFFKLGRSQTALGEVLRTELKAELIIEVLQQLKYCPSGLDEVLKRTVSFGVAFHHAGLTMDERDIIEGAFRNGAIRVLVATSTLSSGVNLPARRVIIRSVNFHGKPIDILTYHQMIGRAGRMGKDTMGESFLVCQEKEFDSAKELMSADLKRVESCLESVGKLERAILEIIASGVASTPDDVKLFTNSTFLASTVKPDPNSEEENPIEHAVTFLLKNEFIRLQKHEDCEKYAPSSLGKACLSSSISPDEGLALFAELEKARQCLVLETELHLIYLVTPYSACNSWGNIEWLFYLDLWDKLPASMKRVGELVGVRDSYIVNATRGKIATNTSKLYHTFLIHKRFFVALALQDLVNEKPLSEVCAKFNCNRGMLQSLQQSASSFAGMVTAFSRQLGWNSVEILLSQFQERMQFGVSRDLLDLMRLPAINSKIARTLYNSGIEGVIQLANSKVDTIEDVLHKALPFESAKEREGESEYDNKQRNKLRKIWISGKDGVTEQEAAEMLVSDARNYLKLEVGLVDAKWERSKDECTNDNLSTNSSTNIVSSCSNTNQIKIGNDIEDVEKVLTNSSSDMSKTSSSDRGIESQNVSTEIINSDISISSDISNNNVKGLNSSAITSKDTNNSPNDPILDDINFSFTQLDVFKPVNIPNFSFHKKSSSSNVRATDVSHILMDSPIELNISDSSMFSPNHEKSIIHSSDQSWFEESFTLELSSDSHKNVKITLDNNIATDLSDSVVLDQAFSCSLTMEDKAVKNTSSEDLFNMSIEENNCISRKRFRESNGVLESTPSKKKKVISTTSNTETGCSWIDDKPLDVSKINIVNVCNSKLLLETFLKEIEQKPTFSLAVACTRVIEEKPVIGIKIVKPNNERVKEKFTFIDRKVEGISFSWDGSISYFISIDNESVQNTIFKMLKRILSDQNILVKIFDSKEQIKVLKQCCDLDFNARIEDPKVADWILDPEGKEKNLQALAISYCPEVTQIAQLAGSCKGIGSVALDLSSSIESKIRASVECLVTWHVLEGLKLRLSTVHNNNLSVFETEMQSILSLAQMELTGMSVSINSLEKLVETLKSQLATIEKRAYAAAGRRFNFVSSADVAKAIGSFRGKRVSTKKSVLEQSDHPISDLVLQWRKINCTLTKMIYPLIRVTENGRIHGNYITHTATGRITMHEPNLQTVAKDFTVVNPISNEDVLISCRNAFAVPEKYLLVSADYCQLELRILAHLSQDKILRNIMNKPGDVFRSISAKWNHLPESEVDDTMRQNTKHLCYGIIYGMGAKTLSQQMNLSEDEATVFMETFRNAYPGIKHYVQEQIEKCRKLGYVETISGRRRYLPHINNDSSSALRSQAERQAVNTSIQGSAADIAKKAMVAVKEKMKEIFAQSKTEPKLILHLHDELIYEAPQKYVNKVARIMKKCMESAVQLSVPFPVKIKTGPSWGQLSDYEL